MEVIGTNDLNDES